MTLRQRLEKIEAQEGLSAGWLIFSFVLAVIAIVSRNPSLFRHPQFFAEDGTVWYAQAYNGGWIHALTVPYGGYLCTLQRLGVGFSLNVPLQWAPLPMMILGLLLQALPVPVLLSSRCSNWASLPVRLAFAAAYVAIPNADEVHVVLTNSQWHLAILLVLLAFATTPPSWPVRIFEAAIILLGSLTGPFAVMVFPLVCIVWWVRRQRWTMFVLGLMAGGIVVQLLAVLTHHQQRFMESLGATPALFVRLIGGNAFIGALLGSNHPYGMRLALGWSVLALALGLVLIFYCFRYASLEVRLFFVFCGIALAGGLRTPAFAPTNAQLWPLLLPAGSLRYWFFPGLALLFAVLWCAISARARVFRWIGLCCAMLLCLGIWKNWKVRHMVDVGFRQSAIAFDSTKSGEHVLIPINPPGWTMELIKK